MKRPFNFMWTYVPIYIKLKVFFYIKQYITIINQARKLSNMKVARCVFCNNSSHTTGNCNSNMNGRRKILTVIGMNFMLEDETPDFKSFPINELRFIASTYVKFQKQTEKIYVRNYLFQHQRALKCLYSPIQYTLTKTRMIQDLTDRWRVYRPIRNHKKHRKPEDECDDCPICMDAMSQCLWNPTKLNWEVTPICNDNVVTRCGHSFCGSCWDRHIAANGKVEYDVVDGWQDIPTGRMYINCPMCRHQMHFVK